MSKKIGVSTILIIMLVVCGSAHAVTIDFGPGFGAPASGHVVLTDQLSSYGVTFSTTDPEGVFWFGGDYYWEPARYSIASGDLEGSQFFVEPIRVDFSTLVTSASIRGFDGGGDIDTLILNAYDGSDNLVDSMIIEDPFSASGLVASVFGSNISYITFSVSVLGGHGLFFDDLTFTPVPVPGAVWLLGSGLVAMFGFKKKRQA